MKTLDPGVMAIVYDEFSNFVRSHHVYYSSVVRFESTRVKRDGSATGDAYAHRDQRHHAYVPRHPSLSRTRRFVQLTRS